MADLKKLAKHIIESQETRTKVIQGIIEDTHKLTEGFKKQREKTSKELEGTLAKSQSLRKKDFNKMMEEIILARKEREENVKKMLADFRKEQTEINERLQELLQRGSGLKLADFKKTLADIKKDMVEKDTKNMGEQIRVELAQMREGVYGLLENLKKETKT